MSQPLNKESPTDQEPSSIPQPAPELINDEALFPDLTSKTEVKYPKSIALLIIIGTLFFVLIIIRSVWMNRVTYTTESSPSPSITSMIPLSPDQYLLTISEFPSSAPVPNTYQIVGSTHIKIENKETGEVIDKLLKPITTTYNYGKAWGDTFEKCEYNEDKITSFVHNPSSNELIPLEVEINKIDKTVTASLPYLFPNDYNQHTEVVFVTPASKYIDGCGVTSRAYLDNNRFVFKEMGYSLQLPDPTQRPGVVGAESINAYIPLPNHEEDNLDFYIYTTLDRKNLTPFEYDQVTHGYEMASPKPYIESGETIQSKEVSNVIDQPALFITTKSSDKEYRYIFIKNPAEYQNNISVIYVFQLSIPLTSEDDKKQNAITLYKQTVNSIQFTAPIID